MFYFYFSLKIVVRLEKKKWSHFYRTVLGFTPHPGVTGQTLTRYMSNIHIMYILYIGTPNGYWILKKNIRLIVSIKYPENIQSQTNILR